MGTAIEPGTDTDTLLQQAVSLMRGARVAVLTGAGVSTDSGIPDYRGEGAPVRTPMTFQSFLASEPARRRYWAGSHLGWRTFGSASARCPRFGTADPKVRQPRWLPAQ